MTYFDYDNIPDNFEMVSAMPDDFFSDIQRMFKAAQNAGLVKAQETKIARVYDRKGYMTMDGLGEPRNTAYGSSSDDVVVQLTIRIQVPHSGFAPLQNIENILLEQKANAEKARLLEELRSLELNKSSTESLIEEKKKKLSDMGVQL